MLVFEGVGDVQDRLPIDPQSRMSLHASLFWSIVVTHFYPLNFLARRMSWQGS
jgi:hypothetical protein